MAAKDVLIVWFFVLPVLHCFWEKFVLRSKRLVECFNKGKLSGLTNHCHRINAEISWQAKKLPVEFTNMEKYRRFQSKLSWLSEHPSFWNYFVNLERAIFFCNVVQYNVVSKGKFLNSFRFLTVLTDIKTSFINCI